MLMRAPRDEHRVQRWVARGTSGLAAGIVVFGVHGLIHGGAAALPRSLVPWLAGGAVMAILELWPGLSARLARPVLDRLADRVEGRPPFARLRLGRRGQRR